MSSRIDIAAGSYSSGPFRLTAERLAALAVCVGVGGMPIAGLTALGPLYLFVFLSLFIVLAAQAFSSDSVAFPKRALPLLAIYLAPYLSYFWSIDPAQTGARLIPLTYHLAIFYLAYFAMRLGTERMVLLIATCAVLLTLPSFVYALAFFGALRPPGGELGSLSNQGAALAIAAIPAILLLSKRYWIVLIAIAIGLVSEGRSAFVLGLVAVPFTLLMRPDQGSSKLVKFLLIAGILAGCAILVVELGIGAAALQRFSTAQIFDIQRILDPISSEPDYGRAIMLNTGMRAITEYWPTGIGYGSLPTFMREELSFGIVSHNVVITFAGELGLIGIAALLIAIAKSISVFRKSAASTYKSVVISMLVIIFVQSLFRPPFANLMLPVALAALVQLDELRRRRSPSHRQST